MEEKKPKKKWAKTLQFFAAYLVAAWTLIQFVDWVLNRYNISPHWVDILLWVFIGIIPSLLIYLYHQDRLKKRNFKRREKIIFPLNILLIMIVTYFGFGNSDLGATTKSIEYENELGEQKTALITKEEFRIGIPIYNFEQLDSDSTTSWLNYGISKLLYEDLLQNKNISPDYEYLKSTTDKIRDASMFNDFYVDGTYRKNGDDFEITTFIRKASNGKELKKQTFRGPDVLTLIDEMSVFITSQSGFVESNSLQYLDLPINEFMSNSLPAIEQFVDGNYTRAFNIDTTFALAYLQRAKRLSVYNLGKLETQTIIDKAFALKNKLPLQKQLEVYIQRNLAYNQFEDAEQQVKLQLEVDPKNDFYNRVLFSIYGRTKQIKKDADASEALFNKNRSPDNGLNFIRASLISGKDDFILNQLKPIEIINPIVKTFKLEPFLHKGNIGAAKELLDEIKLQYPEYKNTITPYDSAVAYLKSHQPKLTDLEQFVGRYRSHRSEQTVEFWIENNRLLWYLDNQRMKALIPAGINSVVSGFVIENTLKIDVVKNSLGKVYAIELTQYTGNSTGTFLYWKLDESINVANDAFEQGNLEEAQELYAIAIENNPENSYLKNMLSHATYKMEHDTNAILQQNEKYAGSYGPRNFWLEDGKFYYKRKAENSELSKVELLPISENRYMNLTRLSTLLVFEVTNDGEMVSLPYSFDEEKMEWTRLDDETNYFIKDK